MIFNPDAYILILPMKTALITGASQGIGAEFAKLLAADGYDLILVSRNSMALQKLEKELSGRYQVTIRIISQDLSIPGAAEKVFAAVEKGSAVVDVLINNAGFGTHGAFVSISLDQEVEEIQVNTTALISLTKLFLSGMIDRKNGKILNVASTAAFQPGPYMAVYYATKAFVLSFSDALSEELKGTGVTVTTLCPGATKTGFFERAQMAGTLLAKRAVDPAGVARAGYQGMMQGKRLVIPGWTNSIGAFFAPFVPRLLVLPVVRRINTSL